MSSFNDLAISDGNTTPVSRTFKAVANVDGRWRWVYLPSDVSPAGAITLHSRTYLPKDPNGVTKHEFELMVPFVETPVGAAPRVVYFCEAKLTINTSGRSTLQERKDLRAYLANFLDSTRASEMIVDGDLPR